MAAATKFGAKKLTILTKAIKFNEKRHLQVSTYT